MWPFKNKRSVPKVQAPVNARDVPRVRGDYTLSGSEAIYAAVSRISSTMAMLPMHFYRGWEIQREDWREKLCGYMPNATMTPFIFQQTMEAFRNTEGCAYALIVPSADGTKAASLDVLDAARVRPLRDTDTQEIYYEFTLDDGFTRCVVHSSNMIVLQHMSANGERGIRPLDVLRGSLAYNDRIREYSLSQLDGVNGGVVLTVPQTLMDEERKANIIEQFLSAYKKSGGRLIVLDGGLTANMLASSPVDSKALDVERITKNRVATVYGLPPHMLGDYADTSYSTAEQSKREFLDLTILPIVRQWEDQYNLKLLTWKERQEGYRFRFDLSEMLRADAATMAEANQKAIRGGWKRINEVRAVEGLPPDDNGNALLCSRDLIPLDMIRQEGK